jgi:hypothetical protein
MITYFWICKACDSPLGNQGYCSVRNKTQPHECPKNLQSVWDKQGTIVIPDTTYLVDNIDVRLSLNEFFPMLSTEEHDRINFLKDNPGEISTVGDLFLTVKGFTKIKVGGSEIDDCSDIPE